MMYFWSKPPYLSNQYNAIVGVNQNLYTYPVCNCEVMSVVDDCAQGLVTVTFDSYDADLGVLTMTGACRYGR